MITKNNRHWFAYCEFCDKRLLAHAESRSKAFYRLIEMIKDVLIEEIVKMIIEFDKRRDTNTNIKISDKERIQLICQAEFLEKGYTINTIDPKDPEHKWWADKDAELRKALPGYAIDDLQDKTRAIQEFSRSLCKKTRSCQVIDFDNARKRMHRAGTKPFDDFKPIG